jgi:hypothetical protein
MSFRSSNHDIDNAREDTAPDWLRSNSVTDRSFATDGEQFLQTLFAPDDWILLRPIETWLEDGKKKSRVDWKGTQYIRGGLSVAAFGEMLRRTESERTNAFFGVCPRFGNAGKFDRKWQIRTIRCLWADIDDTGDVDEVVERCEKVGLPEPSVLVHSGNGIHVYWLLKDTYFIDDAGDPTPVETEWIGNEQGNSNGQPKKRKREYIDCPEMGERLYLDNKLNEPSLSPKAQHIEDILKGIAFKLHADHTTDLSRILRLPGTLNRKNQRKGQEPLPCKLIRCEADRTYDLERFVAFADLSPDKKKREKIDAVPLPTSRKLNRSGVKRQNTFQQLLFVCRTAETGARSEADFNLCCWSIRNGVDRGDVQQAVADIGKFAERGEEYFARTWSKAEAAVRLEWFEKHAQGENQDEPVEDHASPQSGTANGKLPTVYIPGGAVRICDVADRLGELIDQTEVLYSHGGALKRVARDHASKMVLEEVQTAALPSMFEKVAVLARVTEKGAERCTMTKATAELISGADDFVRQIRPLNTLSQSPVLIKRDGNLTQIYGYDRGSGILTDTWPVTVMPVEQAKELLQELLSDFRFASEADYSRAMAAIITPALVLGGVLGARAPIDLGEADESQTGKGYRNKITAAVYGSKVAAVAQKGRGSVGSLEEAFNGMLLSGMNFLALDNVRGKIDSPAIESFLTEDSYIARAPYSRNVLIDPRRTVVMMTSNKAEVTRDLANRCSCVRLRKRDPGYKFRSYQEGDLLEHIRVRRSDYLGAVFAIIRAWHAAGEPTTDEHRHDFRRWAQILDWIVQKLLGCAPLMDGHLETQTRMTNPHLSWLRDVALAVHKADRLDQRLRTHELLDLLEDVEIEIPGYDGHDVGDDGNRTRGLQALGRKLSRCFGQEDEITLDEIAVHRFRHKDHEKGRDVKEYEFLQREDFFDTMEAFPHSQGDQGEAADSSKRVFFRDNQAKSEPPGAIGGNVNELDESPLSPPIPPENVDIARKAKKHTGVCVLGELGERMQYQGGSGDHSDDEDPGVII